MRTPAGIPRTWSRNTRSRARRRTVGHCDHSSGSPLRRPTVILSRRSCRWRCRAKRGRRSSTKTSTTGLTRRSKHWRGSSRPFVRTARSPPVTPRGSTAASAMVLADGAWADKRGLAPTARLVAYGIAAVEPGMFGLGPVPAVKQALQRAGWDIRSIERVEINEAFAAIAIVVARELGLPEDVVNIEGGAVAHGHPIGATGAVLTTKLIHSMRRDGLTRGLVTLCIGGGQGIALAIEAIA